MIYYVLSKGSSYMVTNTNPYQLGVVGYSIHEFDGVIPDLNTHIWDDDLEAFVLGTRTITSLNFLNRFTSTERGAILASTDPVVRDFIYMFNNIVTVGLDSVETIATLDHLAATGLINPERVLEIRG